MECVWQCKTAYTPSDPRVSSWETLQQQQQHQQQQQVQLVNWGLVYHPDVTFTAKRERNVYPVNLKFKFNVASNKDYY